MHRGRFARRAAACGLPLAAARPAAGGATRNYACIGCSRDFTAWCLPLLIVNLDVPAIT